MQATTVQLVFNGIAAFGTLVAAAALIAAFRQLRIMRKQLADARQWNRMSFAFRDPSFSQVLRPLEQQLNATFVAVIDRTEPLNAEELKRLLDPEETDTRILVNHFLNELERFCAAINMGIADEAVAKRLYAYKLTRHYVELQPYIQRSRETQNAATVFCELEDVAKRWTARPPQVRPYGDS